MKNLRYCWRCGAELVKGEEEGRERLYCPECQEFVYRNSVPVAGVFVVRGEEVLLIKRGGEPNKGDWSYPAGYLEFEERPEHGAIRELKEETGLKTDKDKLVLVSTIQLEHPDKYVVGNAYTTNFEDTQGEVEPGSDAAVARFWTIKEMRERVDEMESREIVDAAEKAIKLLQE